METAEQINKDLQYLFGRINWGDSFIDADAARIMNELPKRIYDLEKQKGDINSIK